MPFTRTLHDVREQVACDDQHKWDATVPCRDLTLIQGRLTFPRGQSDGFEQGLSLTPWAMNQACQKLGMPAAYFRKCPPALQDQQFNYWNQSEEVGMAVRQSRRRPRSGLAAAGQGRNAARRPVFQVRPA